LAFVTYGVVVDSGTLIEREDEMRIFGLVAVLNILAVTGFASAAYAGDAVAGEGDFKKCKACHSVIGADGTDYVKGGKTGPNLYGVIGRPVASYPDFAYGDSITAVGATGAVWDEASFAAYVVDPAEWLKTTLGDPAAKSKMSFKLKAGGEDIAAYLASLP
jgi:cytochrome c